MAKKDRIEFDTIGISPEPDALDGLRIVGRSTVQSVLGLDARRLIPLTGVGGVCYCLWLRPDWQSLTAALLSITVITVGGIVKDNHAKSRVETGKDPPEPGGDPLGL